MTKKEKVNKIKEEQLKELQLKLESIREAQLRLGQIESQKYDVISVISTFKKDLNEWNDTTFRNMPKRGSNSNGLTEHEQELKEVGSAAEYRPHIKKINKLYDEYWDSVKDFQKLLIKWSR